MVGYLYQSPRRRFRVRVERETVQGLPLACVPLPPDCGPGRLRRSGLALSRLGVRRVLTEPDFSRWEELETCGIAPVDPLPLCRAKGAELALYLLQQIPFRRRRVALRGERAEGAAQALAGALCPQVGTLLLDFRQGGEELARRLRGEWGAVCLSADQAPPPLLSLELAPRESLGVKTLRLWGKPELAGLTLRGPEPTPDGMETLPFLELLWETGRLPLGDIAVCGGDWP